MKDELIAAILNCRVAEAHVKLDAARAANLARMGQGMTPAYGEEEIHAIIEECGIHHNAIHALIADFRDS